MIAFLSGFLLGVAFLLLLGLLATAKDADRRLGLERAQPGEEAKPEVVKPKLKVL